MKPAGIDLTAMPESFDPYYRWLGIPSEEQPPNHYRLLGVTLFEADPEVITNAADQRMSHLRQFQAGPRSALSQKLLNEVATAKVCLLVPDKKSTYDAQLRATLGAAPACEMAVAPPPAAAAVPAVRRPPPIPARGGGAVAPAEAEPAVAPLVLEVVPVPRRRAPTAVALACVAVVALLGAAVAAVILAPSQGPGETAQKPASPKDSSGSKGSLVQRAAEAIPQAPVPGPVVPPGTQPGPPRVRPPRVKVRPHVLPGPKPEPPSPAIPAPSPDPKPDPVPPEKPPEQKPPETAPPGPAKKQPVPGASVQAEIARQVEDLFHVSESRTPSQSLELAGRLMEEAGKPQTSADERYVLLKTALDAAMQGGDAALVLDAVNKTAETFEIDALSAKRDALVKFAGQAGDSARRRSFVEASLAATDEAATAGRFDLAAELTAKAQELCQQSPAIELRGAVADWSETLAEIARRKADFDRAVPAIKTAPDDPGANQSAGLWHGFVAGDWKTASAHLAKAADEKLRDAALREGSPPSDGQGRAEQGDRWWDLASAAQGPLARWFFARAAHWYLQALPDATGLTKAKLLKRLGDVAAGLKQTGPDARLAVAIHKALLGDPGLADADRKAIEGKLPDWERLASPAQLALRPGGATARPGQTPQATDDLLRAAAGLVAAGNLQDARAKLTEAVRQGPDDIRAAFSVGLIEALKERDPDAAEKRFADCVRRKPDHVPSLNNLALVRVRLKKYRQAVRDWETALRLAPDSEDLVHNMGRLQYLHESKRFMLDAATLKALAEARKVGADQGAASYRRGAGWRFMAFSSDAGQAAGWPGGESLEDRTCNVCGGRGLVDCPNRGCKGGRIKRLETRVVGRNPVTGAQITETVPVPYPCPVCHAKGQVDCQACNRGIDRDL